MSLIPYPIKRLFICMETPTFQHTSTITRPSHSSTAHCPQQQASQHHKSSHLISTAVNLAEGQWPAAIYRSSKMQSMIYEYRHPRKICPVRGRRARRRHATRACARGEKAGRRLGNATHRKSGRESYPFGAGRISSGIRFLKRRQS